MSEESGHHEVRVYQAQSALRQPRKVFVSVISDIISSRRLAFTLAVRDVKAQYRQSLLGLAWMLLPPLFFTVAITVLRSNDVIMIEGPTQIPLAAFVLVGTSLWQMFMASVNGPINALMSAKGVLTRVNFPRETVIFAEVFKILFTVGIQMILIFGALLWFRILPSPAILLFPIALVALLTLGLTVGIFLAPVALLYKDISNAMPIVGYLWMALTPVLMSINDLAPGGLYRTVVELNPVTPLVTITRELLTGMSITHQFSSLAVFAATLVALMCGLVYFRVAMPIVIERWSS